MGVCGDMASHPDSALALLALGVDEISAGINAIPELKACLAGTRASTLDELASRLMTAADADEARMHAKKLISGDPVPWKAE